MNIKLRQRLKGDKISLYLDYYSQGIRKYEYLQLYLIPESENQKLTKAQKDENKKTLALAESIRSKRHLEIQNGLYGFQDFTKIKASFIKHFESLVEKRKNSRADHHIWLSTLKHIRKFSSKDISFSQIDRRWLDDFKEYLLNEARSRFYHPLTRNTAALYFSKIVTALKIAYRQGFILRNPADESKYIKRDEVERQFLTLDELKTLVKMDCKNPVLKRAFLFSALTGLRRSDISKLKWADVQYSVELGHYIRFTQTKTKGVETLPISEQALDFLGASSLPDDLVFANLKNNIHLNKTLNQWIKSADINKHITFHCARHTYATLQLTFGTDIYTVSKLLGHKDLKTTQIYAKIIDSKKVEAANKIII